MELKGKVDSKKAEAIVKELADGLEEKARKELNVFKCAEHIKDMLLFGLYDEAVNMDGFRKQRKCCLFKHS
jgi:hypothetical protein